MLVELGHSVSGSDTDFHPPMGPALAEWGVECRPGFVAHNLEPAPDLVVIGNVCRPENPEARAAFERGLEVTHIAGALQRFVLDSCVPVVVCGTHGKTTTASMCAWLLESAGRSPGFFVGGIPENFGRGFRGPREGGAFVMEGDEYDTAFFEKTAKFLHYRAKHAILTSIEHDHIDIYPTLASYTDAFRRFVSGLPASGVLVANADDPAVVNVVGEFALCRIAWYSSHNNAAESSSELWHARAVEQRENTQHFELFKGNSRRCAFELPLSGEHNLANAIAAVVVSHECFGVPLQVAAAGLARFSGSKRRQQLLATIDGVNVYDDFAHHPTAVEKTLAGLKQRHPGGRLLAAFEPRSATACRRLHQERYTDAFGAADEILLAPVGRPELGALERLDTEQLASDLRARGKNARAFQSRPANAPDPGPELDAIEAIITHLSARARPGDTIVLLSNGAFGGIHSKLIVELQSRLDLESPDINPKD
jgi:UDP-N-acetylmuramate: L-alanyl-gamma-D-glutamyl-meso-diaminopimelate ligase